MNGNIGSITQRLITVKTNNESRVYLGLLLLLVSTSLVAQQKVTDAGLIRLLKLQDSLHHRLPIEKLYLQTDKPAYAVGDTIWFKGYTFDADYFKIFIPQRTDIYRAGQ